MRQTGKHTALATARILSLPYRMVPARLRRILVFGLALLESRIGAPEDSLRRLFALQDNIEHLINERATALGKGLHPKHRLMRYHDFFVERIPAGSRVLDIGCGTGAVARSIAERVTNVEVMGIDMDERQIALAQAGENPPNLSFLVCNALDTLPQNPWDIVVLSNILEHIDERVAFLAKLKASPALRRILVRVPLFERSWQVPMRRELGIDYFSDKTHCIEHRLDEFDHEISAAGLEICECFTLWGEIWATCQPKGTT